MSAGQLPSLPEGHIRLNDENLGKLSVKGDELFWDGKPIATKLSGRAKLWVGITGVAALLAAILSIVTNGHTIAGYFEKQPPPAVSSGPIRQPIAAQPPAPQQPRKAVQKPAPAPSQPPRQ
jgi:hypothetical protein